MGTISLNPQYPLSFRSKEGKILADYIRNSRSVELIGMKRVGINHFLHFFLSNPVVKQKYFDDANKQLFIPINLNNLIERNLLPFWRLTFKRIVDEIVKYKAISDDIKSRISELFLYSIQTDELLFTLDGIRESLILLSESGFVPTLFLIRFDRLKSVLTAAFFDNLKDLVEITDNKLSFVITSRKSLPVLVPDAFNKADYTSFAKTIYIKPANKLDSAQIIDSKVKKQYLKKCTGLKEDIIKYSGGHLQYIYSLLFAFQDNDVSCSVSFEDMFLKNENITLLSEEIYRRLDEVEQKTLTKILSGATISDKEKKGAKYLWDTGILDSSNKIFSPIFEGFVKSLISSKVSNNKNTTLTKKELLLFEVLKDSGDKICNREIIAKYVWPEYLEYGVSDWTMDRLVARLRKKLKLQNSEYKIKTIKTRGFQLVKD